MVSYLKVENPVIEDQHQVWQQDSFLLGLKLALRKILVSTDLYGTSVIQVRGIHKNPEVDQEAPEQHLAITKLV